MPQQDRIVRIYGEDGETPPAWNKLLSTIKFTINAEATSFRLRNELCVLLVGPENTFIPNKPLDDGSFAKVHNSRIMIPSSSKLYCVLDAIVGRAAEAGSITEDIQISKTMRVFTEKSFCGHEMCVKALEKSRLRPEVRQWHKEMTNERGLACIKNIIYFENDAIKNYVTEDRFDLAHVAELNKMMAVSDSESAYYLKLSDEQMQASYMIFTSIIHITKVDIRPFQERLYAHFTATMKSMVFAECGTLNISPITLFSSFYTPSIEAGETLRALEYPVVEEIVEDSQVQEIENLMKRKMDESEQVSKKIKCGDDESSDDEANVLDTLNANVHSISDSDTK